MEIAPQPGPQEAFLSTPADIAIYGGAAGGGKSYALLLEPLRHIENGEFRATFFRRTMKQVTQQGGMWDTAEGLYPALGAKPNGQNQSWTFPSGMEVRFSYLQHEKDKYQYQGAQIPLIGFDELTHFSEGQFFYMLSRLRSGSGVPGYVRATCNPDPDSWVARLIAWWIGDDGIPLAGRAGAVRYFVKIGDEIEWGDSREELIERFGPDSLPLSVTFIPARLSDNPILMRQDPAYKAKIQAMDEVTRAQLLDGNWKIRPAAGMYFRADQFHQVTVADLPPIKRRVRYWDRAATEPSPRSPDPDFTAGVLIGLTDDGRAAILDVERFRLGPFDTRRRIAETVARDGEGVRQVFEEDPGQAGKSEVQSLLSSLAGYNVKRTRPTGDKLTRALPFSAQVQAGNVMIVEGEWNDPFLSELQSFCGDGSGHDDQVDAAAGAFNTLTKKRKRALIG